MRTVPAVHPHNILVVDDDEQFRQFLVEFLEGEDFRVTAAADGTQGLAAFDEQRPALLVSDLVMPGKEGIELIMEVRRRDKAVPIIAMSGGNRGFGDTYLKAAEKLGANLTLEKPFSPVVLLESIGRLLSG